jgi:hypothetical protein
MLVVIQLGIYCLLFGTIFSLLDQIGNLADIAVILCLTVASSVPILPLSIHEWIEGEVFSVARGGSSSGSVKPACLPSLEC